MPISLPFLKCTGYVVVPVAMYYKQIRGLSNIKKYDELSGGMGAAAAAA